jgi:hypothetical protein
MISRSAFQKGKKAAWVAAFMLRIISITRIRTVQQHIHRDSISLCFFLCINKSTKSCERGVVLRQQPPPPLLLLPSHASSHLIDLIQFDFYLGDGLNVDSIVCPAQNGSVRVSPPLGK